MGRSDDIHDLLEQYFDSWENEDLESQCWRLNKAGRITKLDDKLGGDYFRTDLQNALGQSEQYNVQTQPNRARGSGKSSKSQSLRLAGTRSHAFVLIHRDATPKADAVRDAFKSSASENKYRLNTSQALHTKVIMDKDGSWRNEDTGDKKQAADYEAKVDLKLRDPLDELSEDQKSRIEQKEWGVIFKWRSEVLGKQRKHTMTDQDWVDYETKLAQLKRI